MATAGPDRRKAARSDDPELRGRRSEPRACVLLVGSAEALTGHRNVTLLDVSLAGARIEGRDLPQVGREIILKSGPMDTFGVIVWAASGRCGVQFDEPLELRDLLTLREMAQRTADSEMTPDERMAAADWMNGLAR